MHQQIRVRIRTRLAAEAGGLKKLLEDLKAKDYNLSVAGYSALDPDAFVIAIDHEKDAHATSEAHKLIVRRFDPDAELEDLTEGTGWATLDHVPGALLQALTDMQALDAPEVFIGVQGETFFVQVRRA